MPLIQRISLSALQGNGLFGGLAFLALIFAFSGCSTIDYSRSPPADWPVLAVEIVKQDFKQVQRTCRNDFWPERQTNGCAIADWDARICRIFTWTEDVRVIEHERAHCLGYDHPSESGMRDAWNSYKQKRQQRD